MWELPPLARGKDTPSPTIGTACGITPARAGKRKGIRKWQTRTRNYPRSRGEKRCGLSCLPQPEELPPLARGKAPGSADIAGLTGITPARAGKSPTLALAYASHWNYPRSRGEKVKKLICPWYAWELPPLARGKAASACASYWDFRITPARAGKRGRR